MTDRVHVPLNVASEHLLAGDVLSYRMAPFLDDPLGWPASKAISICGRSADIHTAMLDRQNGDFVALGMRLLRQKLKLLSDEVVENPQRIDVYRVVGFPRTLPRRAYQHHGLPAAIRGEIVAEMRRFALANHYGWLEVLRSGLYFLPLARWFVPHHEDLEGDNARPYCSQAVSHAIRKIAGIDLLQNRPDRLMLPGDVVSSPLLAYLFTLAEPTNFRHPIEAYFEVAGHG